MVNPLVVHHKITWEKSREGSNPSRGTSKEKSKNKKIKDKNHQAVF